MSKSIYSPRVVVASQQGNVLYIKSKQSGRVLLKLKLLRTLYGEEQLYIQQTEPEHCRYIESDQAAATISKFDVEVKP